VKHHNHIRSLFLPWIELSLNEHQQRLVEDHLKGCESCRQYFDSMSLVVLPSGGIAPEELKSDPFLPTRIRALAEATTARGQQKAPAALRWALRTALFAIAMACGIYMGEKLSSHTTTITDQNVITEYSDALQVGGIADRLQTVAQSGTEESK
jgi:predicted anti-sigma-YlaC factor YlaD